MYEEQYVLRDSVENYLSEGTVNIYFKLTEFLLKTFSDVFA